MEHQSSENQLISQTSASDQMIDSKIFWSILIPNVEKNICLISSFVFVFILTKILKFTLLTLSQDTFLDYIIYLLSGLVHFMSVLHNTHTEIDVLLMCINYNSPFWWKSSIIKSQYSWITDEKLKHIVFNMNASTTTFSRISCVPDGTDGGWTDFLSLPDGNNNFHCTCVIIRLLSKSSSVA